MFIKINPTNTDYSSTIYINTKNVSSIEEYNGEWGDTYVIQMTNGVEYRGLDKEDFCKITGYKND